MVDFRFLNVIYIDVILKSLVISTSLNCTDNCFKEWLRYVGGDAHKNDEGDDDDDGTLQELKNICSLQITVHSHK